MDVDNLGSKFIEAKTLILKDRAHIALRPIPAWVPLAEEAEGVQRASEPVIDPRLACIVELSGDEGFHSEETVSSGLGAISFHLDQALKVVKRGGTVSMAVMGNVFMNFAEEPRIIGSVIGLRTEMEETLNLASKRMVAVKWQAFKLSESNDVLLRLKRSEIVGRAVLVP